MPTKSTKKKRLVGGRRSGMSLDEACVQLVRDAKAETDPFMRDLLLATAAGATADKAYHESKGKLPNDDKLRDAAT